MLTPKATKAYVDTQLLVKSNTADMTAALALKADKTTTYTISQVDTALALKANQATRYTKTETDNLLAPKATTSYVDPNRRHTQ